MTGHIPQGFTSHWYQIFLSAQQTIVADGFLTNGEGRLRHLCNNPGVLFLNSNGPLVFTAFADGWHSIQITAHPNGADYDVAYAVA